MSISGQGRVSFSAVPGAPFTYAVSVAPSARGGFEFVVEDEQSQSRHSFTLPSRDQASYRAFFADAARRLGTSAPFNASRRSSSECSAPAASYRLLLDRNIDPRILYGYGDPAVTRVSGASSADPEGGGNSYYLLITSNDAPDAFPILLSRDLEHWELRGFVFPREAKPLWAADGFDRGDFWAPELHQVGERFVVCFAARGKNGELAIGLAFADHPEGPYRTASEPLLRGGVIDPHILVDAGKTWLYWKDDSNDLWPGLLAALLRDDPVQIGVLFSDTATRRTASLAATLWPWIETLEPMERFFALQTLIDAVAKDVPDFRKKLRSLSHKAKSNPADPVEKVLQALRTPIHVQELDCATWQLKGKPVTVLENDQKWEAHLIEGVWVTKAVNRYFMFYSGNDFSTPEYGIGVAIGDNPLGPFIKHGSPIAASTSEWSGPGHPSVAITHDGTPLMFLHAFPNGKTGYKSFRALLSLRLHFERNSVSASD